MGLLTKPGSRVDRQIGGSRHFEDCRLVHQMVDRSGRVHGILEGLIPLRKDEVAGDHEAAPADILADVGYVQQVREEVENVFTILAERNQPGCLQLTSRLQIPFAARPRVLMLCV